jgi:hypothetical protein
MVKALPDLSQLVNHRKRESIEYLVPGTALGFNLWNKPDAAAQITFLTTDTEFSIHTHKEQEYILLVSGSMKIIGEGTFIGPHQGRTIDVGGGCHFAPGIPHGFNILENSCVIGITIPASEAYPGGGD